jgi:hypothetical protein
MTTPEQTMRFLEEHIPELAESAVTQAYWQALASGSSVLESDNGVIYEVFPDCTRKLNWRKPMTALMMPKTGSTVVLHRA